MNETKFIQHLTGDHFLMGTPPVDRQAANEAAMVDAPADRRWFMNHPGRDQRDRPASSRERRASGLGPDARMRVCRLSNGAQLRIPYYPESEK
jgi:hypothetical protein